MQTAGIPVQTEFQLMEKCGHAEPVEKQRKPPDHI